MQILNSLQIGQKVTRLAYEILENNYEESGLILAGINNRGLVFAKMLKKRLESITSLPVEICNIRLNPADPLSMPVTVDRPIDEFKGRALIIVDDVANTGRTLFYAFQPFLAVLPKKIEIAVLVDRKHKQFPVLVDYMGLSLATTLRENIEVLIDGNCEMEATLS